MRATVVLVAIACGAAGPARGGDDPAPPFERTVVVEPRFEAGFVRRWLWGAGYRDLYTSPVTLPVLDLGTFGGGLTPTRRVGAGETGALALAGADGRAYTFRPVLKETKEILPVDLRETLSRRLLIDQMPANHPAGQVVASRILEAAGVLHSAPRLVVMPDDPRLGEFQPEFAGAVGDIEEWSGGPGFGGAVETIDGAEMWRRLRASPDDRPDAVAYLRARLVDHLMGDWDRHRDQWRFARLPGQRLWQPIPEDRDQAFSRYEGLFNALLRPQLPLLVKFGPEYSSLAGLTYDGWDVDKRILAGVPWSEWEDVAKGLQAALTDAVIGTAARRLPDEYFARDGGRLIESLTARRDDLPGQARRFYAHVNRRVDVFGTDVAEEVEARRFVNGDLELVVSAAAHPDAPDPEPYFRRRFEASVTREVRLYLHGGDDKVTVSGGRRRDGVLLRVIGGDGADILDDVAGGDTRFSGQSADDAVVAGPRTHWDRRSYTPPPPNPRADWMPPRDSGRVTYVVPQVAYGTDYGLLLGAGLDTTAFGFRRYPWSSQQNARLLSTMDGELRGTYVGQFRFENSPLRLGVAALGSGIEVSRFFGFGNETGLVGDEEDYSIEQDRFAVETALVWAVDARTDLSLGVVAKDNTTEPQDNPVLDGSTLYGEGQLAQIGLSSHFRFDGTDGLGLPRRGVFVTGGGTLYPSFGGVEDTFGDVRGQAHAYLATRGERAPTLVFKAGGQVVFGRPPFFEAAFIGGKTPLSLLEPGGGSSVRGLPAQRYSGDASLYGGVDLYVPITRSFPLVPGQLGIVGFVDVGRVFLSGETSRVWHHGVGGGVFLATPHRRHLVSFTFARAEGHTSFYVRAGLGL